MIGKIIASDLREIASHLYEVGSDPGLDTSRAIWENLIMTAITCMHWLCFFLYGSSLVYTRMWQPRGSASTGGDDVMAFRIRFLPMARDVSRGRSLNPYIDDARSL